MDSFVVFYKKIVKILYGAWLKLSSFLPFIKNSKEKKSDHFKQQIELDKKLVFSLSKSRIPNLRQFKYIKKFLSQKELFIVRINIVIIIICLSVIGFRFYKNHLQEVPVRGGKYVEALIGAPAHVNPLYASVNDVDSDISSLVFSSLFKRGKNGELIKDLVENYEISANGKIYSFKIKEDVKWQSGNSLISGSSLNVDDIVFTFGAIKNKQYKSPLRTSFSGVEIEKIDDQNFKFILSEPYAAFLDLLTFGVLPANLWSEIAPESFELTQYQKKPIGSGPYRFDKYIVDTAGNIKEYDLVINDDYYGQKPYVDITFKFYPSFEEAINALNSNEVDSISYLPSELKNQIITPKSYNYNRLYIPQLTAVFFNQQGSPALADKSVRKALAKALDRNKIISDGLAGDAYLVDGPILPNSFAYDKDIKKYDYDPANANELLNSVDWKLVEVTPEQVQQASQTAATEDEKAKVEAEKILRVGEGKWRQKNGEFLIIRLTTVDRNENRVVVEAIKSFWETLGVKTEISIFLASQIQNEVLKSRNFDALFYGQVLGADPDPYAFWHSSQVGLEGYNIANFNNKEVDQLLEDARLTSDTAKRQEYYKQFQKIVAEEEPAIFMYSPVYIYPQNTKLKGFAVKDILLPSDRLANVQEWYLQTGKHLVW